jgi:hypothetical protein
MKSSYHCRADIHIGRAVIGREIYEMSWGRRLRYSAVSQRVEFGRQADPPSSNLAGCGILTASS